VHILASRGAAYLKYLHFLELVHMLPLPHPCQWPPKRRLPKERL
jgi:hypothetical protein